MLNCVMSGGPRLTPTVAHSHSGLVRRPYMQRREVARFHTVTYTRIKRPGFSDQSMYVVYVLDPKTGNPSPAVQLIEYFTEHGRTRTLSWQSEVARAVGLFVDFLTAKHEHFKTTTGERPQVLAAFAEALVAGTINANGDDPTGLFWEPKKLKRASHLLNVVTAFSDWLVQKYEATPLNPWKAASPAEQMAYWRRFDKRHASSILAHTASRDDAVSRSKIARKVGIGRKATVTVIQPVKHFPEERIWDLLFKGFALAGARNSQQFQDLHNIRDMMITILLHGGGLRESEPFHLYVSDIGINPHNPKSAVVRLYHPEQGTAPADYIDPISGRPITADREEYLRVKWGLQPRNLLAGRFHAGWKDLQLSNEREKFTLVHWFPSYWGEIFLALFKLYVTHFRSRHCPHPYLFVSHKQQYRGHAYTIDSFRQAHARAVQRIGLVPSAQVGTSPHGHRHAYGQRMADNELPKVIIQRAMHHKSPQSQEVYTVPTDAKVEQALREAQARIHDHLPVTVMKLMG